MKKESQLRVLKLLIYLLTAIDLCVWGLLLYDTMYSPDYRLHPILGLLWLVASGRAQDIIQAYIDKHK